jgi:hypothetical protein
MNEASLKTEATALRKCLLARAIPVSYAIRWADQYLERTPQPLYEVIAVSMATSRLEDAIADLLDEVPGTADAKAVLRNVFRLMADSVRDDSSRETAVAAALYAMALADDAPSDSAESFMLYFDDAFALALDGIYGDLEMVRAELRQFLSHEAGEAG